MDIMTFFEIYNHLYKDFSFENDEKYAYIMLDEGELFITKYQVKEDTILFTHVLTQNNGNELLDQAKFLSKNNLNTFFINHSEIEAINIKQNLINIKVEKSLFGTRISKLSMFIIDQTEREEIYFKINIQPKIYSVANSLETIIPARLTTSESINETNDIYLLDSKEQIRVILREHLSPYFESKKEDILHFNTIENKQIIFSKQGKYYFINPTDHSAVSYDLFRSDSNCYMEGIGTISGLLQDTAFNKQKIDLAITKQTMTIIDYAEKTPILTLDKATSKVIKDGEQLFIKHNNCLAMINGISNQKEIEKYARIKSYHNEKIVVMEEQPYFFTETSKGVELFSDLDSHPTSVFLYPCFKNVTVILEKAGESFRGVQIKDLSTNRLVKLFFPEYHINEIIYKSFVETKALMFNQISSTSLYTSMVRQISDLILYEYFGQLSALYKGIDEFYNKDADETERTAQLVNYLYYGIQSQRKRMDYISVYLPSMLNKFEQDLYKSLSKEIDEKHFKDLQIKLLAISNQMKSGLMEIENSLTHLSSSLVSRTSMDKVISERRKLGYTNATIAGAAGIGLSLLTGGAALPFLLAPAMMGLNTKDSTKIMELQQEIQSENEQNRTQLYLLKALDMFDHFVKTMLPFYISRVNEIIYETYKKIGSEVRPLLDEQTIRESVFQRIAEIYTFKKLPVDDSVEISKDDLLKELFQIAEEIDAILEVYSNTLIMPKNLPVLPKS
jgi:hypothetical protein